ncbi:uncharacterized protein LOC9632671 isoform X1 [Selaginella moellendorffii]|uniref:uncharacterized protein LOC9632671 isoform X1 n=1 Tax=Selaginella moellendorffii TaxID=88036 RepID=UPI000D1C8D22|nr:uncharacterized protein LOC9632671 isoform X1 [Selaginella moellendorffii]|eukprot:XP_024531229.1 uncharacterized protein LOC9632671 isoform X1 [Selaginella moellendorffii]
MFLGQKALTPAVSLDMSGWKEVLRSYLENPTNGPVKPEDETLEQRTTRDAFLEQASPMKFEDGMFKLSPRASLSPKAIMEVLSPRGLGRQPQTHFEAQLRAATAENVMKTAQSLSPTKRVSSPPPAQNVLVDMGRASQQLVKQEGRIKQLASFGRWALEPAPASSSSVWLLPTKKPRFSSPGPLDVGK